MKQKLLAHGEKILFGGSLFLILLSVTLFASLLEKKSPALLDVEEQSRQLSDKVYSKMLPTLPATSNYEEELSRRGEIPETHWDPLYVFYQAPSLTITLTAATPTPKPTQVTVAPQPVFKPPDVSPQAGLEKIDVFWNESPENKNIKLSGHIVRRREAGEKESWVEVHCTPALNASSTGCTDKEVGPDKKYLYQVTTQAEVEGQSQEESGTSPIPVSPQVSISIKCLGLGVATDAFLLEVTKNSEGGPPVVLRREFGVKQAIAGTSTDGSFKSMATGLSILSSVKATGCHKPGGGLQSVPGIHYYIRLSDNTCRLCNPDEKLVCQNDPCEAK